MSRSVSMQNNSRAYATQKGLELCCIVEAACQLVQLGQIAYQRDVYYRYKHILHNVSNVSKLCQQVAEFLGICSSQLNIIPSPKGMVFGSVDIELRNGTTTSCLLKNGQYIPPVCLVQVICRHEVKAIILVEKQTAFQAILECGFSQHFPWAMLITGKGYPDKNTCQFIEQTSHGIPVYAIVDYDPDGACIYKTYAEYCSTKSPCRSANTIWAGLHCTLARVDRWGLDVSKMAEYTQRDRKLSMSLIKHWVDVPEYRRRMSKMVYCGKKVELEAVTQIRAMLLNYIMGILKHLID
ncbi:Spo11/DNA topoisomerase VI subunit A [Coemansia mojavensis]|nr:Spo11/DNA topoisomerase VI subunit A [Coemansia mojavensis]